MSSRRLAPSWVAVVIALVGSGAARAQDPVSELSGYVTLSSGYWKHGLAHSDGASLQLGIDYQHYTGFFAYARAMNVDYPQNLPGQTSRRRNERLCRLSPPPAPVVVDCEPRHLHLPRRRRLRLRRGQRERWVPRPRVLYALRTTTSTTRAAPRRSIRRSRSHSRCPRDIEIGGAVGYFDVSGGPKITHWNVGVSKLVGRTALDLRYYDGNYEWRNYLGDPEADNYVLSVSYALRGKRSRN